MDPDPIPFVSHSDLAMGSQKYMISFVIDCSLFRGSFFGEGFPESRGARGPGARAPYGPGPIRALAHMGHKAHMDLGPYGP